MLGLKFININRAVSIINILIYHAIYGLDLNSIWWRNIYRPRCLHKNKCHQDFSWICSLSSHLMILIYFLLGLIASLGNSFTKKVTDHIFLKATEGLEEVLQISSVLKLQSDSKMAHFKKKKKDIYILHHWCRRLYLDIYVFNINYGI